MNTSGKGDSPRKVNKKEYDKNFTLIFGEKKLNVMSDKDREEMWKEFKIDIETERVSNETRNK